MSPYYGKHIIGFEHCYDRLLASDFSDEMSTNFIHKDTFWIFVNLVILLLIKLMILKENCQFLQKRFGD